MSDDKEIIVDETVEVIEEVVIEDDNTSKTESFFRKIKDKTGEQYENYKKYAESEQKDYSPKTSALSDKISWDLIKILFYILIMSFLIDDVQNFLVCAIVALLLIKLDILEPIFKFIRSFMNK